VVEAQLENVFRHLWPQISVTPVPMQLQILVEEAEAAL
jgi:hypothetical protein